MSQNYLHEFVLHYFTKISKKGTSEKPKKIYQLYSVQHQSFLYNLNLHRTISIFFVKFIYSEKATKFWKISRRFVLCSASQIYGRDLINFVAFSEDMNFNSEPLSFKVIFKVNKTNDSIFLHIAHVGS